MGSIFSRLRRVFQTGQATVAPWCEPAPEVRCRDISADQGVLVFRTCLRIPDGEPGPADAVASVSNLSAWAQGETLMVSGVYTLQVPSSRNHTGTVWFRDESFFTAELPAGVWSKGGVLRPGTNMEVVPEGKAVLAGARGDATELTCIARFRLCVGKGDVAAEEGGGRRELPGMVDASATGASLGPGVPLAPVKALLRVDEVLDAKAIDALCERVLVLDVQGVRVIDVHASVTEVFVTAFPSGVTVAARVFQQVYFVAEDGVIRYQHDVFDVEKNLPVSIPEGATPRPAVSIRGIDFELDEEGRLLHERFCLQFSAKVMRPAEIEVVTDVTGGEERVHATRDRIRVDHVVGTAAIRHVAEDVLELPITAARMTRILAVPRHLTVQVIQGRVLIDGTVACHIFFADHGGVEHNVEREMAYHSFADLPQVGSGMQATGDVRVEGVEYELQGGRQLRLSCCVLVAVRVVQARVMDVVTAVMGEGVVCEEKQLRAERLVGQTNTQDMLEKRARLVTPSLRIVKIVSSIKELNKEIIPDEVIIQGKLLQHVFFIDRQKVQRHQTEEIGFSRLIRVPGALPGMAAEVDIAVRHTSYDLCPDAVTFAERVVLDINVRVVEDVPLTVITSIVREGDG